MNMLTQDMQTNEELLAELGAKQNQIEREISAITSSTNKNKAIGGFEDEWRQKRAQLAELAAKIKTLQTQTGKRMATEMNLEEIKAQLKDIQSLDATTQRERVPELIEIRAELDAARRDVSDEQLTTLDTLERRYKGIANNVADYWQRYCDGRIKKFARGDHPAVLEDYAEELRVVGQILKNIVGLDPTRDGLAELQELNETFAGLEKELASLERVGEIQADVKALWAASEKIESQDLARALDSMRQGLEKAEGALAAGGWERRALDELTILKNKAFERYEAIRLRHDVPTTKTTGEGLVEVIVDFSSRDPNQTVTYFEDDSESAIAKTMKVSAALPIAHQRLLKFFWRPTTERYIADAEKLLGEHKPREAMAALERCGTILGRDDDRIRNDDGSSLWPKNLDELIVKARSKIQPEFDAYGRAEGFVAKANQAQDPIEQFRSYKDALDAYIYYPDLDKLRLTILDKAKQELVEKLEQAEQKLRAEEWHSVRRLLERADKLLELDSALQDEFQDRYANVQEIYQRILPLTTARAKQITLAEEQQILEGLRQDPTLTEYWKGWTQLQKRLAMLEARSNIGAFIQQANSACVPNAKLEELAELERQCKETLNNPTSEIAQYDQELHKVATKLEAWIGFARARDELAKIEKMTKQDGAPDDTIEPPDLEIVKSGIQAASKEVGAKSAAAKLQRQLGKFETADKEIENALGTIAAMIAVGTVDKLLEALKEISKQLAVPTSHRRTLLALKRQAQTALADQIEIEAKQTLADARQELANSHGNPFAKVSRARLELLATKYKELPVQEPELVKNLTALPILILKATEIQNRAEKGLDEKRGVLQWETARKAWQSAADTADDDVELKDFALHRAKLAFKHNEFQRAQREPDPNVAEQILAVLQNDTLLRNERDVWYEHGKHCLETARASLDQEDPRSVLEMSISLLDKARVSLNRARKLVSDGTPDEPQMARIDSDIRELNDWDRLATVERAVQNGLESGGNPLTFHACTAALRLYTDAIEKQLAAQEPKKRLEQFWNGQRAAARQKLEAQILKTDDIFAKLDAYLAMDALYPAEPMIHGKLATLVIDGAAQIQSEVNDIVFDYTGQKFFNRLSNQARNELHHGEIIRLQSQDTDRALSKLEQLNTAIELLPRTLVANNRALSGLSLSEAKKNLMDWSKQLAVFQVARDQALTLMERGLRQPDHFKTVRYILRLGGSSAPLAEPVPDGFRNEQHPTLRWLTEQLYSTEERRKRQEDLLTRIEICLRLERVERAEELGEPKSSSERALFDELRQKLASPTQRTFPLEEALKAMRQMAGEEKHDVCGLQEDIIYLDPDNYQHLHNGLEQVESVIAKKVRQVQVLRHWLGEFRATSRVTGETNPGFVNWDEKKIEIERLRDSHRDNLALARKECARVRQGDEAGMIDGVWSLQKTFDELDPKKMMEALRAALPDDAPADGAFALCKPAENLNQERQALRERIDTQRKDAKQVEDNIVWRIQNFNTRWESFQAAQNALLRHKKKWHEKPEWQEYQTHAEAFCKICPNWDEFQNAMQDVIRKTKLPLSCSCLQKNDAQT